jgi:FAD:protein FMN transferase
MKLFKYEFTAMASKNKIAIYASNKDKADAVVNKVISEVHRIENKYSRYNPDSLLSIVNKNAGDREVKIDSEFRGLLYFANVCYQQSNGTFDITSGVLRKAWDFKSGQLPDQQLIDNLLPLVDWKNVTWSLQSPFIKFKRKNMQLDFGGIGKEFAVDRSAKILYDNGIYNGVINYAGDIFVLGPHLNGDPWSVEISHPRKNGFISHIEITKGAIATSGDYERYFILNNRRYCHILNPKTGYPVENSFQSVSVVAPHCVLAGSTATITMLKGVDDGKKWLKELDLNNMSIDNLGEVSNNSMQTFH